MASLAVDISIGLIGLMVLWMGFIRIAEKAGVILWLAKLFSPLLCKLMPGIPKNHPAIASITMNMTANMLGLDNAATPLGLQAMKDMQKLNPNPSVATDAQIMFLVINTSSVTLFPITIFLYRAQQGAANPADVFIPILLATLTSTTIGLVLTCLVQKINLFQRAIFAYFILISVFVFALIAHVATLSMDQVGHFSNQLGSGLVLLLITFFLVAGVIKKVPLYDCFIDGAKSGLTISFRILPYLLSMLIAIGLLRTSGVFDYILSGLSWFVSLFNIDTQFIEALPTALMKPFSGSGSRALMIDAMNQYGADSFQGRLAALFQGSTDTTFYVLTVYFGSVGIRYGRHAVYCGLAADFAGFIAAIFLAYYFYG